MTRDPVMQGRVFRLTAISGLILGLIAVGAAAQTPHGWAVASVGAGWVAMPVLLALSLRRPGVRILLVVPAGSVLIGLTGVCASVVGEPSRIIGWSMVTVGIAIGGVLGLWFWYRLLPVPVALDDPSSPGRWSLIGLHVGLVALGIVWLLANGGV
jgi:hypothetical protein